MKLSDIRLDENMRELTVRGEPGYPISIYEFDMEGFLNGSVPWHWHREIEFIYIAEGGLTAEAGDGKIVLHEGQGAFFNSGVLHRMYRGESPMCKMVTVAFDALLLSGAETSIFHSRYILPLMQCQALPVLWLTGEVSWHQDVLRKLSEAFQAYEGREFGNEIVVRQLLCDVWMSLLKENNKFLGATGSESKNKRLKQMLQYLQSHISEQVRLEDVAKAADVSVRECTRCFQAELGITPIFYLTQLRVQAAAAFLEQTDDPVTEISIAAGFESPGYFSRVFKQYTGFSPREYRKSKESRSYK